MATAPGAHGKTEEGIDPKDKIMADLLELLVEEKLATLPVGQEKCKFYVSNMQKINDNILTIVENRYKAVGWVEAKIVAEPRTQYDTEGNDPYVYTVILKAKISVNDKNQAALK